MLRCFGSPSKVIIPSTVREIGDGAFSDVHSIIDLSFEEGLVHIGAHAFQRTELTTLTLPASLEVIGEAAFLDCYALLHLTFAAGSQLQCIHREAFLHVFLETAVIPATVNKIDPSAFDPEVWPLIKFDGPPPLFLNSYFICSADSRILLATLSDEEPDIVPSSVETISDRCFENIREMETITFSNASKLKRIGERAFAGSRLASITIPASTEEIDGSAFVGCPIETIRLASGSRHFRLDGDLLVTSEGTEIVRYFGRELKVIVPKQVEILGKSSFEECNQIEELLFENGSKLLRINRSALSGCKSLLRISIPASVEIIESAAFKGCEGVECCVVAENANLVRIANEAFAGCCSLRAFYVPRSVEFIGENCFKSCVSLRRLRFVSGSSLKRLIGNSTLDDGLETFGLGEITILMRIEIEDGEMPDDIGSWSSVPDSRSHLTLVQDIA
jgi:hypothetical protein